MTFIGNLKGYRLIYSTQAKKAIDKVPKHIAQKIYAMLENLVNDQSNLDVKKLRTSREQRYRVRAGDYRIIYTVWKELIIVYVIEIGHRKEIYRGQS